ncbi:MAG: glycosyltransferase family 61 protein [Flavisolibacter sp.]
MGSLKRKIKSIAVGGINLFGLSSKVIGTPKRMMTVKDWVDKNGSKYGARFQQLIPSTTVREKPPVTLENKVHDIYAREYVREQPEAFVAIIPSGRVWGRDGAVISPGDVLLTDVSREFGRYGGVTGRDHSINSRLHLSACKKIRGNIAVVASAGASNYHHWLYDTLPRIHLLRLAGLLSQVDYFVMDYTGLHFQKDSLQQMGIPVEKLICCNDPYKFHIEAEQLFVPSLPARLGTSSKWTVDFLRETFLKDRLPQTLRLYISRRKAQIRKLLNEDEVFEYLKTKGFVEFLPEDHTIEQTASYFASAEFVIGVHGSGFANFAFLSEGSKTVDIVEAWHLDPYYWILSNHTNSTYAYIFGKGDRPDERKDLVVAKVNRDILIDIKELDVLFNRLNANAKFTSEIAQ